MMKGLFRNPKLNKEFEIGYATDRGIRRKANPNQDSLIVLNERRKYKELPVLIIADGMGGYAGGAKASQMIIQSFTEAYPIYCSSRDFTQYCESSLIEAHKKMKTLAKTDEQYASMGSTIIVTSIDEDNLQLMNVGDSRAYLVHLGEMQQINYDHSFVGEALRAGLITKAEAMKHPKKNQLTQSISARRIEVKPYFSQLKFDANDILILCSDGLWGVVAESMIQAVIIELSSQEAANKLIKLANAQGGPDNISVAICKRKGAKPLNPFLD